MKSLAFVASMLAFCAFAVEMQETVPPPQLPSAPEGVEFEESSAFHFNAGGGLRLRQEIMHNVPSAPGGVLGHAGVYRGKTKNQVRLRPDVWMEVKYGENWRFYTRVIDEMRAGIVKSTHNTTYPGEAVLDNFYIEGKNLFDGAFDLRAGRQDLYHIYGLDHIFSDGTPGDGSATCYADMANIAFHIDEKSWLDLFALWTHDREELRWGTKRSRHVHRTSFGRGEPEMDDWGFGIIWNSSIDFLDYKLFWIQKDTASFHRDGVKHPRRQVNLYGVKLIPHWTQEFSTPIEAMGQIGRNGDDDTLHAWAFYAGFDYRKAVEKGEWRPFWNGGLLVQSGDKDTASEDGGRHAWDPMWYRGVEDSEMFVYGCSSYGVNWWSNQINLKTTLGIEFGYRHKAQIMMGPMWAQEKDGIGGGDGRFKGFLTQARYDFPLYIADKASGGRLELFGHVLAEFFNPGDYFETDKPAYFFRWQLDLRF